jgi:RHS repeat-associated protein
VDRSGGALWRFDYDRVGNRRRAQVGSDTRASHFNQQNELTYEQGGGRMLFRGILDEPGTVSVDGHAAKMKEGNVFEAEIDVTAGENIFTITAADLKGNTSFKRYKVDVSTGEASYSYDNNGNLTGKTDDGHTWTYEWTVENQLARVTKDGVEVATFQYDPLGRRVEKIAGGVTYSYLYDGQDILRETRSNATIDVYIHGPGIDEPLAKMDQANVVSYFHADGLGSITKMTDSAGAVVHTRQYDAWGNLEQGADQPGYAFTGREWDPEIGLYYYRARYYEPKVGRFISEDPIGLAAGVNMYSYVDGQPTRFRDPSGLDHWLWGSGGLIESAWAGIVSGFDALTVRRVVREVRTDVETRSGTINSYGGSMDAFRHCLIGCRLTNAVGREKAIALETIHEFFNTVEGQGPEEFTWDAYNYGRGNKCAAKGAAPAACYEACMDELYHGRLGGRFGSPSATFPK